MKAKLWCIIMKLIISGGALFAQENSMERPSSIPLITTYTPLDYQAGIQNWDLDQDTTGYLYIANNYGLLEFDGAKWTTYEIVGSTKTRSVLVDRKSNRIYTGGQRQVGYFIQSDSGFVYVDLIHLVPDDVPIDEVWNLIEYKGRIIANITGRVVGISDSSFMMFSELRNVEFINTVNDRLLAGSTEGLFVYNEQLNKFEKYYNSENYRYRGLSASDLGYYAFTYDGEIFEISNGEINELNLPITNFLRDAKINKVLTLANGNLVVGTQNNGLIILSKNLKFIQHLTKNKGLSHRTVVALYEDNFNNLWVGLNNGICSVELGSPFSLINENVGLEGTGYSAIMHNNTSYYGTSSGLFMPKTNSNKIEDTKGYQVINGTEGLVNKLNTINNNIIISHHEGALQLNNNRVINFFEETGTWEFKQTASGEVLGGTYFGFYLFGKKNSLTPINELSGLNESSRIFEFENDTVLWMTHGYKGAYKLILAKDSIKLVKRYGKESGFPSDVLISVYKIDDELIFTAENGIYQYNRNTDSFEPHSFLNKWFENNHVSKIIQDSNDNIYYIADREAGVLEKVSIGVYERKQKQFKKINQYLSDDLENINILTNNAILFGAKEGFVLYEPGIDSEADRPFKAFLKRISYTNIDDVTKTIMGPYFIDQSFERPKNVRFEFSSPFYNGSENLTYSYRLLPYEDTWSGWSSTEWKEYTNLPYDDYSLEIKAKNIYGDESIVSSYSFVISPRWYESDTAYVFYWVTIIVLFMGVLYSRERKHRNEKESIHQSKNEALRSKDLEIVEFSEKTNQQIQALRNENLKKEIDHKNSQLASITMHLLSKNEFVMSIRKKLGEALNVKDNTEPLSRIVKSIDNNIDKDEAWETFAYHFDQVHGDFLKNIKEEVHLTPQETKLCAYLRMNMSTKDIANLMNITIRGVELARYRLRKKLDLERDQNLVDYLLHI